MTAAVVRIRLHGLAIVVLLALSRLTEPALAQDPMQQLPGGAGTIMQGETKTHSVEIDQADTMMVILLYDRGDLNLALISPKGDVFDSTRAAGAKDVMWSEGPFPFGGNSEAIGLYAPQSGTWTIRVTAPRVGGGAGVASYMASVLIDTSIRLEAITRVPDPIAGEPLVIRSRLTHQGLPITDAVVRAKVIDPNENNIELSSADNGFAPDSIAGDGIYTTSLDGTRTCVPGEYRILLTATGTVPGSGQKFHREDATSALMPKSHSVEDFDEIFSGRKPGPLEPPIEIRSHLERDPKTGAYWYVYSIANGSPFGIYMFHIGTGVSSNELKGQPVGWEDVRNVPRTSYRAPSKWRLLFGMNNLERGSLMWSTMDSTALIAPGQALGGFRVNVAHPDPTYERSHWMAFLKGYKGYEGAMVPTREPFPSGDAIDLLGHMHIARAQTGSNTTIRFTTPTNARPVVAILNSQGEPIRALMESPGKGADHEVLWDGKDEAHREAPAGEYFVLVKYGNTERYGRINLGP